MIIKVNLIFILSWVSISLENLIVWSKEKKISWNDFQATAPKLDSHIALSRVEIQYESSVDKEGKMTMEIRAVFIKDQSWVKQDRKSDNILKHEQYHFNLTEVWARKLRRDVTGKKWNPKTFEKEFNSMFKKHMAQTLKEQLRYDNETNHSQLRDKQTNWEQQIDKELVNLKMYSETKVPFLFE